MFEPKKTDIEVAYEKGKQVGYNQGKHEGLLEGMDRAMKLLGLKEDSASEQKRIQDDLEYNSFNTK